MDGEKHVGLGENGQWLNQESGTTNGEERLGCGTEDVGGEGRMEEGVTMSIPPLPESLGSDVGLVEFYTPQQALADGLLVKFDDGLDSRYRLWGNCPCCKQIGFHRRRCKQCGTTITLFVLSGYEIEGEYYVDPHTIAHLAAPNDGVSMVTACGPRVEEGGRRLRQWRVPEDLGEVGLMEYRREPQGKWIRYIQLGQWHRLNISGVREYFKELVDSAAGDGVSLP